MIENPYRAALDGWTENQWRKNGIQSKDGTQFCLLGRMFQIDAEGWFVNGSLADIAEQLFPERAIRSPICVGFGCRVAHVNDHYDTTFEDVCQVLEKAAVRWDEQQAVQ